MKNKTFVLIISFLLVALITVFGFSAIAADDKNVSPANESTEQNTITSTEMIGTTESPENESQERESFQVIQTDPNESLTKEKLIDRMLNTVDYFETVSVEFVRNIVGENGIVTFASTIHTNIPQARYDILIDPKMAFGTGHHQTTSLMLRAILASDMTGKRVLDMGCGTALLAILARKCGATQVTGIDIDEFAYENALENIRLNDTSDIDIRLGGVDALKDGECFDFILANINRNILLADMAAYAAHLHSGASIFMSGFYLEDMDILKEEATHCGLRFERYAEDNRWTMMQFVKE